MVQVLAFFFFLVFFWWFWAPARFCFGRLRCFFLVSLRLACFFFFFFPLQCLFRSRYFFCAFFLLLLWFVFVLFRFVFVLVLVWFCSDLFCSVFCLFVLCFNLSAHSRPWFTFTSDIVALHVFSLSPALHVFILLVIFCKFTIFSLPRALYAFFFSCFNISSPAHSRSVLIFLFFTIFRSRVG